MLDLDTVDGDARQLARQLGEGRVVALSVRRLAGQEQRRAVLADLDAAPFAGLRRVGDLDVGGEPDAEQGCFTCGAPPGLFGPELGVPRRLEGSVEGLGVLAGVHGRPGRRRQRECLRSQEVPSAHLGGVDAAFGREQVDHALDRRCGLWSACAAIGAHRHGVGDDRLGLEAHVLDVIDA